MSIAYVVPALAAGAAIVLGIFWLQSLRSSLPSGQSEAVQQVSGSGFTLSLHVARANYRANEPIEAYALITYTGSASSVTPWGSSSGIVGFGLSKPGGPVIGPGYRENCRSHPALERGKPLQIGYAKSGGYSEGDPDAAFLHSFFADPGLRLPAGTWTMTAETHFRPGGCIDATPIVLRAAVTIVVSP